MGKMFIQDTTLTNIADAIREKTNTTASLFPENMPAQIRSIQTTSSDTTGIPEDIVEEANRVANGMISKMGANSLTFIAMSDMHQRGDNDGTGTDLEQNRRANLNAGQAAKLIADKVPLDFFTNLGDLAWGAGGVSKAEDVIESQLKARQYTWDVEKNHESFFTTGNHDTYSTDGYLTYGAVVAMTGTYRYVDFDSKKVRVICLNTSDVTDAAVDGSNSSAGRVSGEQLKWFAETLDLSSKSNADSWKIVILSHMPLDWSPYTRPLANCLNAYVKGLTYSTTHDSVSVSYNFSGKNAAKIIAQFHGHTHCFKVDYINEFTSGSPVQTSVKRVAIPQCCFTRSNTYGTNPSWDVVFGESVSCIKSDNNTGRNTSFCLVSIDLDNEIIYADCFGSKGVTEPGINAGYDRVISYATEEIVTYSITNNLANASTSNTTGNLAEGSNYTATITVDDGYELGTIVVTMGGTDITSTAVSGNNISIANVTGDVVITVTTIKITPYTVSYDLANVESSNTSTETTSNTSFATTLTAKEGCSINFVRVLMGGVDVTSDVYENNSIDIETVTGDIEIIAGHYTNLVPTATTESGGTEIYNGVGYRNGMYISDENTYREDSAAVSTGHMIMTEEDVIYVKGAEFTTGSRSRIRTYSMAGNAYIYSSDGVDISSGQWLSSTGALAYYIEQLGDKYYKLTPNKDYFSSEQLYFRISLYGTGERLIVTKNEPIHEVGSIVTYTVTNNLTNTTTDNSATSINADSSYSATLTADNGYELKSVTITMGGTDVTSSVYSNGTISISSVTGNIVVTATATEIEPEEPSVNYTNLVTTSIGTDGARYGEDYNGDGEPDGYKNGKYASGSSEGTDAACVLTGLIAYGEGRTDPIYVKGADVDSSKSHCRILGFASNRSVSLQSPAGTALPTYFTIEKLGTSYYKLTPTASLASASGYTDYLRFSLIGTGANLIITINEPIE